MIYLPHRRKAFRSSWTPASIANLALWFDAQQETYANNDAVGQWSDRSANAFHMTATSTARPTFKTGLTNGGKTFCGLLFDGSANVLTRSSFNLRALHGANYKDTTLFIVQNQTGTNANNTTLYHVASGARLCVHATYSNTLYFDIGNDSTGRISVAQPTGWDDTWKLLTCSRNVDTQAIRVNSSELTSASRTATQGSTTATLSIGNASGSLWFKGTIAELIIYASALSSADISTVESYLISRYGIS